VKREKTKANESKAEVCTIWNDFLKAGAYNGGFNGSQLASGVYFYRITTSGYTDTKKMTLVK
jgi:hypothetical protein